MIVQYVVKRWRLQQNLPVDTCFICKYPSYTHYIQHILTLLLIVNACIHGFSITYLNLLAQHVEDLYLHDTFTQTFRFLLVLFLFHTIPLLSFSSLFPPFFLRDYQKRIAEIYTPQKSVIMIIDSIYINVCISSSTYFYCPGGVIYYLLLLL